MTKDDIDIAFFNAAKKACKELIFIGLTIMTVSYFGWISISENDSQFIGNLAASAA